jgi:acylphosphatase
MRVAFIVHGFVQGVGYRYFVKRTADSLGVHGIVMNKSDGSVLIVAESDEDTLEKFESAVNVSTEHGIQVMKMEKLADGDPAFPKMAYDSAKFLIRK